MNSFISIIMSVHNGMPYLEDAIKGLFEQTYRHFELIAVDDASSDETLSVLENYCKKESRIRVVKNEKNIGLTRSLIKGIDAASGDYLARQDSDDISLPSRLEKQVDFLDHNPSYGAVGTGARIIDKDGIFLRNANVPTTWFMTKQILRFGNCFLHGSMMFRKKDYLEAGGYRSAFSLGQDLDLWLRISRMKKMTNISQRLYLWRDTGTNLSSMKNDLQFKMGALALYDHRFNKNLLLDDKFDINQFISNLNNIELSKYNSCLRSLAIRHGNIGLAEKYLNSNTLNNTLIALTKVAFRVIRSKKI